MLQVRSCTTVGAFGTCSIHGNHTTPKVGHPAYPDKYAMKLAEGARHAGVCNPYQYYGFPNIWPRGYPLERIRDPPCDTFMRSSARPLVLQV